MKKLQNWHRVVVVVGFFIITILVALLILPGQFATVDSQSTFSVEYDTDRRFGDYKHFDLAQSAGHEVCRDHCAADANCKAYTYTRPWQQNAPHCWLKNTVPNPESGLTCCISGVKGGTPPTTNFSGTWNAYNWDDITLRQNGTQVTGNWPRGSLTGTVRGDRLYFSWGNTPDGKEGEALMYPIQPEQGRYGLIHCTGRGCDPEKKREGFSDAWKRR